MQDQNQARVNAFPRPNVGAAPMARGNYGAPVASRQPAAPAVPGGFVAARPMTRPATAPSGPRHMDIAPPQPITKPQPVAQPQPVMPVAAPVPTPTATTIQLPQPVQPQASTPVINNPAPAPTQAAPIQQPTPLFTAARSEQTHKERKPSVLRRIARHSRLVLLIIGSVLLVGGGIRLFTAGNISGYTAAVGAVTINDGSKTVIQFVADDGQLHRFTEKESSRELTPGNAVQVAYRPGAAEATVVQVSKVSAARQLGTVILSFGTLLSSIAGLLYLIAWLKQRTTQPAASQAVPVSA